MGKVRVPVSPHRAVPQHPGEQLLPCTSPAPWGTAAINNSCNQAAKKAMTSSARAQICLLKIPVCHGIWEGWQGRPGFCRVQQAQWLCYGEKGDKLLLARGEGLPGHSALQVALEQQPHSRAHKVHPISVSFAVINGDV